MAIKGDWKISIRIEKYQNGSKGDWMRSREIELDWKRIKRDCKGSIIGLELGWKGLKEIDIDKKWSKWIRNGWEGLKVTKLNLKYQRESKGFQVGKK